MRHNGPGSLQEIPGEEEEGKVPDRDRQHAKAGDSPDYPAMTGKVQQDPLLTCLRNAGDDDEGEYHTGSKTEEDTSPFEES